ncbi:hypothetical protein [Pseudomonas aeruginosa]|uniref:hypothetical protein n=1 Tax=Pseudomonas aeruginosa TaxID=287 RepID=UPI00093DA88A|nr:hypothetical protein [Pseudomonas aeruginosa]HBO1345088.1 hypothetical protein [Pseudomonas aeruginosa]
MSNKDPSSVVAELLNANTQYFQRLAALAQQVAVQGASRSQQLIAASVADSGKDVQALVAATDLPALIAAQLELTRRHWERRQAALQQAVTSGAADRDAVVGELTQAFAAWNEQVSGIVAGLADAVQPTNPWSAYLDQFARFWSVGGTPPAAQTKKR